MRRSLLLVLLAGSGVLACSELDAPALFMDINYQMRCVRCEPRGPNGPQHDLAVLNEEGDFLVDCNVENRDGDRLVSFSVTYQDPESEGGNYSISVEQVNLDKKDPGGSCRVVITELSNTYEGSCTADEPTSEERCQVKLSAEDGVVSGTLYCDGIRLQGTTAEAGARWLTKSGSDDAPALVSVEGCQGL